MNIVDMTDAGSKKIVLSLGGSLIVPAQGIDRRFLAGFKRLLAAHVRRGRRFVVVCGGGSTCRVYQKAASRLTKASREQLDQIGIKATMLNAQLVSTVFGKLTDGRVVTDPRIAMSRRTPVIIGAGWLPGCSSDHDAVLLARQFGAKRLVNLSNIPYVYDRDPRRHAGAKPLLKLTWAEFRRRFGGRWRPGLNSPFDPVAARAAQKSGISVVIADGRDLPNIDRIISGRPFRGSVIG